jgi:hypothetical protein
MLVKWTFFAMVNAEELGINSQNVNEAPESKKPDVMRFVGTEGNYGEELGLTRDWAVRIIRHVGNYGEVYERNVGSGCELAASCTRHRSGKPHDVIGFAQFLPDRSAAGSAQQANQYNR